MLTRYVHRHGETFAVYLARFSDNHPDGLILITVSVGRWGDGTGPGDRRAIVLKMRANGNRNEVMVADAADSPWKQEIFGRVLDRKEALADPVLPEVFHLTDRIVLEDAPIRKYLDTCRTLKRPT